jgi:multidrug efflux pump subunit AcrB
MMIRTPDGTEVPFDTVAEIRPGKSLPSIYRIDRKRQLSVSANAESDELDVDAIVFELEEEFLPSLVGQYVGMSYVKSGNALQAEEDARNIRFNTFLVIIGVYVLLAIPFRSYVKPLVVMTVIPFGIVGAILGHVIMDWLLIAFWGDGVTVNIMSRLGFLALSGVVVNDSLIMVHFISEAVKRGESIGDAARAAGVRRFRPILLTSLTTFAGLLPLMLAQSPQSKFMIPMAISLGWGVIFATVITLFLVPVNSLILDDLNRGFRAYWRWQVNAPSKELESQEDVLAETR